MKSWILEDNRLLLTDDYTKIIKQSIFNMLSIPSCQYVIFPFNYGNEMLNNLHKGYDILNAKALEYLENTLLYDTRINSVSDVLTKKVGDTLELSFKVKTDNNQVIEILSEVMI